LQTGRLVMSNRWTIGWDTPSGMFRVARLTRWMMSTMATSVFTPQLK
jgi:hypothetical protein